MRLAKTLNRPARTMPLVLLFLTIFAIELNAQSHQLYILPKIEKYFTQNLCGTKNHADFIQGLGLLNSHSDSITAQLSGFKDIVFEFINADIGGGHLFSGNNENCKVVFHVKVFDHVSQKKWVYLFSSNFQSSKSAEDVRNFFLVILKDQFDCFKANERQIEMMEEFSFLTTHYCTKKLSK